MHRSFLSSLLSFSSFDVGRRLFFLPVFLFTFHAETGNLFLKAWSQNRRCFFSTKCSSLVLTETRISESTGFSIFRSAFLFLVLHSTNFSSTLVIPSGVTRRRCITMSFVSVSVLRDSRPVNSIPRPVWVSLFFLHRPRWIRLRGHSEILDFSKNPGRRRVPLYILFPAVLLSSSCLSIYIVSHTLLSSLIREAHFSIEDIFGRRFTSFRKLLHRHLSHSRCEAHKHIFIRHRS